VQRFSGPLLRPFSLSGLGSEQLLQLATLEHLHHDVGAANELTLHIELRNRRPIGIFLDAGPDLRVLKDVDRLVLRAETLEDGYSAALKAALGEERGALHEKHDVVPLDDVADAGLRVTHRLVSG